MRERSSGIGESVAPGAPATSGGRDVGSPPMRIVSDYWRAKDFQSHRFCHLRSGSGFVGLRNNNNTYNLKRRRRKGCRILFKKLFNGWHFIMGSGRFQANQNSEYRQSTDLRGRVVGPAAGYRRAARRRRAVSSSGTSAWRRSAGEVTMTFSVVSPEQQTLGGDGKCV